MLGGRGSWPAALRDWGLDLGSLDGWVQGPAWWDGQTLALLGVPFQLVAPPCPGRGATGS